MCPPEKTQLHLQRLIEINQLLMEALEPDELLKAILESIMQLFSGEACSIGLIDETERQIAFTTIAGKLEAEEFRLELSQGIAGWVATMGEPVICNDVSKDSRFYSGIDRVTGFKTRSILCVPLKQRERVIGTIEVLNTAHPDGFADRDLELLMAFAGLAATAINRSLVFAKLRNAKVAFQEDTAERYSLVLGQSPTMHEVVQTARSAAAARTTVFLHGESGTGKEIIARSIHRWSPRADGPFVAVNCVALTPELLESELFGHEKGAFTGATAQKKGKFELADGGTLFLDEIGDLAPSLQAKLLRVLQEREFQRVGGVKDIPTDVRVVAATNRDLREALRKGTFREDLYYRLNVVSITMPPLRERKADIPNLVQYFLDRYAREMNRPPPRISTTAMELLRSYEWPGNVRQLQNTIERALVLSSGDVLTERDLPAEVRGEIEDWDRAASEGEVDERLPLAEALDAFKRARIARALEATGGNQTEAAELLGVRQSNLSRLVKSLKMK